MNRKFWFFLAFLMSQSLPAQGLEDWYAAISEAAGIDPNAGATTFLTLVLPMGGRYLGMAGAYTAIAKDSGFLDANPAGSSILTETELSFFHHDWIGDSRLEGLIFSIRQGDFGLGFGTKLLYIPFTGINSWGERYKNNWSEEYAKGHYTEIVAIGNISYNLFSNYYFHGLTVGGNVKIAYRGVPEALALNQSAISLVLDLGALTKFNFLKFYPSRTRNFSLGATFRNLGFPVDGDPLPSSLVLGMAWLPIRPLTLSSDLTIPILLSEDFSLGNFGGLTLGGNTVELPYVAFGMDLALTSFFAFQSGIQLRTGAPRITAGAAIALEKLTVNVNYSLDLASRFSAFDRISVEFKINLGDLGRQEAEDRARDFYLNGLDFYARGRLREAIIEFEQAVELYPGLLPARESLETAVKTLELQERMEALQVFDTSVETP